MLLSWTEIASKTQNYALALRAAYFDRSRECSQTYLLRDEVLATFAMVFTRRRSEQQDGGRCNRRY